MKCYPMIVVRDVPASSAWYRELLGLTSGHGGDEFEMLMAEDGLALMLHHLAFAEHSVVDDPRETKAGAGVVMYFSVEDVHGVYERAVALGADLVDEPHENPKARAVEFSLRDPDGYALSVSQWSG